MHINWFTVIAQIINFFILVWLLKRFLYKPILKAINERENKIVSQLKDAENKKAEALKEQNEFEQKNKMFDQSKKEMMDKSISESNDVRQKLLEDARKEATLLAEKLEKAIRETHENLNKEILQKTQNEVFNIARKTLKDLSSLSLEEQSVNMFIKRLEELNVEEKNNFINAFKSGSKLLTVKSAFNLPEQQQTQIKNSIHKILATDSEFEFKSDPQTITGIEISANGYKIEWNISAYLNSLQKSISEIIKEKSKINPQIKVEAPQTIVESEKK